MSDYGLSLNVQQPLKDSLETPPPPLPQFDWNATVTRPVPCRTCGALVPQSHHQLHTDWHAGKPAGSVSDNDPNGEP